MTERAYFDAARRLRTGGNLQAAANYYVASAHGHLMKFRTLGEETTGTISPKNFGYFSRNLSLGALCYRIAGEQCRSEASSNIGIRIIEDVRENEASFRLPNPDPPIGLCYELIGDLRLIGALGAHEEAYRGAERHYDTVENPGQWSVEPEFEIQMITFSELADSTDHELPEEKSGTIRYQSLIERIRYKRDHFEEIVRSICESGNWDSDIV